MGCHAMSSTDTKGTLPQYELKDELARFCLPEANRNPDQKLAWMNSICILFLIIGVFGSKSATVSIKPVPPMEEAVPVIVESMAPPPPTAEDREEERTDEEKPKAPQVVVVVPESPEIHFAVPTLGNLVAAGAMAQPPPLLPLQPPAQLGSVPASLNSTGAGGERPQPPYPKLALEQGQQGRVTLLMSADVAGNIISIEVKTSSGFPILDHNAMDYVRRHWTLPSGSGARLFEATITYQLQAG